MFGFSIIKVLFTVAIVIGVWQGFKWLKRRATLAEARANRSLNRDSASELDDIQEMVPCPNCGAFIAKGSDHCCT